MRAAVEAAITLGCADAAAVRHLVEAVDLTHARDVLIELGELSRFERPAPVMTDYDGCPARRWRRESRSRRP